jgi:hypothetical protein
MNDEGNIVENAGDPAAPEPTPEEERDTDRSTIWYTLGTRDWRILRMTLMDQDRETLTAWDAEAERLREEIRRMLIWQQSVGSDRGSSAAHPRVADRAVDKKLDD